MKPFAPCSSSATRPAAVDGWTRRGLTNDLQRYCSQLAKEYPFAARLNSMARQAPQTGPGPISRFYKNCREQKPGKKGYPRFQHDNRSVEYKTSGWKLEPDGQAAHLHRWHGIGTLRLIGQTQAQEGCIETFPLSQIKRVRLLKRADGYYVQFAVQAERTIAHEPTGKQVGIDMGLKVVLHRLATGARLPIPRYLRKAEAEAEAPASARLAQSQSVPRTARRPSNAWQKGI